MSPLALLALLATAEPTRLLVLDLEAVGAVDTDTARSIDPLVLAAASVEGAEILAQSELKRLAEMEAAKAEMGCDTSSCLAELAGAMGARFVLFGSVSRLGGSTTVALSLYDNATASITRDNVVVKDVGLLADALPPRVRALVASALGLEVAAAPPPAAPAEPPSTLFMGGVVATAIGGAALLGGGGYAGLNEATIQDPAASGTTKRTAQENGAVGLVVAGVGAVVAAVGVALIVVAGDS